MEIASNHIAFINSFLLLFSYFGDQNSFNGTATALQIHGNCNLLGCMCYILTSRNERSVNSLKFYVFEAVLTLCAMVLFRYVVTIGGCH